MAAVKSLTGYQTLVRSFERSLLAGNFSPHTGRLSMTILRRFGEVLVERGLPTHVESISREHAEEWIAEILRTRKANTAANRHKALRAFFGWLVDEGEIPASPMRNIKPPRISEEPPAVPGVRFPRCPAAVGVRRYAAAKTSNGGRNA